MTSKKMNFCVALVVLSGCLFVTFVNGDCKAISADDCLSKANPSGQIPPTSSSDIYCPFAVLLGFKVATCVAECNFTLSDEVLNFFININDTCSESSDCNDIITTYTDYLRCFESSGGLRSLIDNLISNFNVRKKTDTQCLVLASGRTCQRSFISKCSYFRDLDKAIYEMVPLLAAAQHICGSENVPVLTENSTCYLSDEKAMAIQKECDISCSMTATHDPAVICSLFQDQVNCIIRNSQGCTSLERRFILPRLNSYAIANIQLQCANPIQIRGVVVQPTGLSPDYPKVFQCNYIPQINDCFQLGLSSIRIDDLLKLLAGNFILNQFCTLIEEGDFNSDQLLSECLSSYLRCRQPIANLYEPVSSYNNSDISLGPFYLDAWGFTSVLSSLSCPNPQPPTLCQLASSKSVLGAGTRPTPTVTRRETPIKSKKNTSPIRTTPRPSV